MPSQLAGTSRVLRNTYALLSTTLLFSAATVAIAAASVAFQWLAPGILLTPRGARRVQGAPSVGQVGHHGFELPQGEAAVVVRDGPTNPDTQVAKNQKRHRLTPLDLAQFIRGHLAISAGAWCRLARSSTCMIAASESRAPARGAVASLP